MKNPTLIWLLKVSAIDLRFVTLCCCTVISSVVIYSAWLVADRTIDDAAARFLAGVPLLLGWAFVFVPIMSPLMVVGWLIGWFTSGLIQLSDHNRRIVSAFPTGVGAVLPVAFFFGRHGQAAQNEWEIIVFPLLVIVPFSAVLVAFLQSRRI